MLSSGYIIVCFLMFGQLDYLQVCHICIFYFVYENFSEFKLLNRYITGLVGLPCFQGSVHICRYFLKAGSRTTVYFKRINLNVFQYK